MKINTYIYLSLLINISGKYYSRKFHSQYYYPYVQHCSIHELHEVPSNNLFWQPSPQ